MRNCCFSSYNWIEHDGRNYGVQTIVSGNQNITVAFVKRPSTPYGGDWTARISVSSVNQVSAYFSLRFIFFLIKIFIQGIQMLRSHSNWSLIF